MSTSSLRLKDLAMSTTEVFHLRHEQLTPGDIQAREDFEDVAEWAESNIIPAGRILLPLLVKKEKGTTTIHIQDGERRWRGVGYLISAGKLPADFPIPCISEPKPVGQAPTRADRLFIPLLANSGKPLNMVEKGRQYVRLMAEGLSMGEIARRLPGKGVSKQSISNDVFLVTKGSPELLDLVRHGKLAPTTALEIAKLHPEDHAAQNETASAALARAAEAGREHATPRDIAAAPAARAGASFLHADPVAPGTTYPFNDRGVCTTPATIRLTGLPESWKLKELEIAIARRPEAGAWTYGFSVRIGDRGESWGVKLDRAPIPSEREAWITAWGEAIESIARLSHEGEEDPIVAALRTWNPRLLDFLDTLPSAAAEGGQQISDESGEPDAPSGLRFQPHILVGRPPEPSGTGDYQEQYRFVLQGIPTQSLLARCHILLTPLVDDPTLYAVGYRYELDGEEKEVLPNHAIEDRIIDSTNRTLLIASDPLVDALHEEGFEGDFLDQLQAAWRDVLFDTETGEDEPYFDDSKFERLAWVAKADKRAVEDIKKSADTNRDGSLVGAGNNGGYADPSERVNEAEKLLEELADTVHSKTISYTTTEIVLGFINGTRSRDELRRQLTQSTEG